MMTRCTHVAFLLAMLSPFVCGRDFLASNNLVETSSIHRAIQETLHEVLGSGHSIDSVRLANIKATLLPIFVALPKNYRGRVSAPFMQYAVQRYFSQKHGWIVKGFEPHTSRINASEVEAEHVLTSNIPDVVQTILGKTLSQEGFALQDLVIAVASIERLVIDEVIKGVDLAFYLNDKATHESFGDLLSLGRILTSYFSIEYLGGNSTDLERHKLERTNIQHYYPHWAQTFYFIKEIVDNNNFQARSSSNPFVKRSYAFEDVVRVTQTFSEEFGPYSNHECHEMKEKLSDLDVHATGRVPLGSFYRSSEGGAWQFTESTAYLRMIGALDESSEVLGPQVIIPNYITGQNNCISSLLYYKVCCLNECDGVFQHLEARIGRATGSASEIARAIEEGMLSNSLLSSSFPAEARNLSAPLRTWLGEIAKHHGDAIPLHGRLLAQWLHFAFPRECPFPHVSGTTNPQTPDEWLAATGEETTATTEEMSEHVDKATDHEFDSAPLPWHPEEELLVAPKGFAGAGDKSLFASMRSAVLLTIVASIVYGLVCHSSPASAGKAKIGGEKAEKFMV